MDKCKISYGKKEIIFLLDRKPRKTIKITVNPDKSIVATAPEGVSLDTVKEKVKKHSNWITKQQNYFDLFFPQQPPKKYIGGESHYYLGKQYRLKIILSDNSDVKLRGGYIYIYTKEPENKDKNKILLYLWYKERAEMLFEKIINKSILILNKYNIKKPMLKIRKMSSRWGSCDKAKYNISLNIDLIKTPTHCIEYVIMHELCHLKYPNHSKSFWSFLDLVMPDWKTLKDRLEIFSSNI